MTQHWFPKNKPIFPAAPALVNNHVGQFTSGSSFNYTPTFTPTAGNLLVMCVGGTATAGLGTSGVSLSGWTKVTSDSFGTGGVPAAIFVKKAVSSESTPYVISIDGGRSADNILVRLLEFENMNSDNPAHWLQEVNGGNVTTTSGSAFDVGYKGVLLTFTAHGGSTLWSNTWGSGASNDGFIGTTQRTQLGYRLVNGITIGEVITWSQGGAAASVRFAAVLLRAKSVYQ